MRRNPRAGAASRSADPLRNLRRTLWGHTEVAASAPDATLHAQDVSEWRPIALKDVELTFAMEIRAFKRCFEGFGTAA